MKEKKYMNENVADFVVFVCIFMLGYAIVVVF